MPYIRPIEQLQWSIAAEVYFIWPGTSQHSSITFQNCNLLDDANEVLNPLQLLFILRNFEIPVIEARENRYYNTPIYRQGS
jgi:hypothetical protein